jgi:hypothetical protein
MGELIKAVLAAPIANLFIVGGLVFLGIAVVGQISGKIEPGKTGRIASGVLGAILLVVGLVIHLRPTPAPSPVPVSLEATPVPPTNTPALPEATPVPPTNTPAPSEATPVPPTVSVTGESSLPAGSWQPVSDLPRQINALAVDPTNPQVLYAGTGASGSGSGVYKSEDAGLTWRLASAGLPSEDVVALAFGRSDPPILYTAVGNSIFASPDGGANWSEQAQGVGNYRGFERLHVAPSDGKTLYGVAVIEGVFRSEDGGRNWVAASEGLPKDSNGSLNAQSLAVDPTDADLVYVGTGWGPFHGNGVYKSVDGGASWASANRGMIDYSITALAVDPANPQIVYAGGDGGELFKSTDGGATWGDLTAKLPDQKRIVEIVLDPATPETIYLLCDRTGVLISNDGGAKWRALGKPGEPDYPSFTEMAVIFDLQPILVVGIEREGGWRYAAAQP